MGIVIVAGAIGALVAAVLVAAVLRLSRRPVPAAWGGRRRRQSGPYVGAACRCGHGQLQFMWRHGFGQILGCSNYPDLPDRLPVQRAPAAGGAEAGTAAGPLTADAKGHQAGGPVPLRHVGRRGMLFAREAGTMAVCAC